MLPGSAAAQQVTTTVPIPGANSSQPAPGVPTNGTAVTTYAHVSQTHYTYQVALTNGGLTMSSIRRSRFCPVGAVRADGRRGHQCAGSDLRSPVRDRTAGHPRAADHADDHRHRCLRQCAGQYADHAGRGDDNDQLRLRQPHHGADLADRVAAVVHGDGGRGFDPRLLP